MAEKEMVYLNSVSNLKSSNASDLRLDFNSTETWDFKTTFETGSLTTLTLLGITVSVCVFLMYHYKRSLRTSANTYVLSLTTSNFLRCVFLFPFYVIVFKNWISGNIVCTFSHAVNLYVNLVSVLSILLIAFDRNCAVNDPLKYMKNNSKPRAGLFILCVWIFSIFLVMPGPFVIPQFDENTCDIKLPLSGSFFDAAITYESIIIFTAFILLFFSVVCLYYSMYRAAHNSFAVPGKVSYSSCISSDVAVNMVSPTVSEESERSLRRHFNVIESTNSPRSNPFLKKHRAAVTGFLVVFSFIICWSPYFIVRLFQCFRVVTIEIKIWVHFSTFLSSILDPYVYFYRNKSTWAHTKKLAKLIFYGEKSPIHIPASVRDRIVTISSMYRLPKSLNHRVLATQIMDERRSHQILKVNDNGKIQVKLFEDNALEKKSITYSIATKKDIVDQDSSSSNYSSEVCATVVSSDSGEVMNYQSLQKKYSEESTQEEPQFSGSMNY